jgi:hypothetical protein
MFTIHQSSVLPNELYGIIIDHLYDETRDLSRCCRVCKYWLSASRYHIFDTVELTEDKADRFVLVFLDSDLKNYIREVDFSWDKPDDPNTSPPYSSRLIKILPRLKELPRLQSVAHQYLNMDKFHESDQQLLFDNLSALNLPNTELLIQLSDIVHLNYVTEMISACSRLQTLSIYDVTWRDEADGPAARRRKPDLSSLRNLTLHDLEPLFILDWLIEWADLPCVNDLELSLGDINLLYVAKHLPMLSWSVQVLDLRLPFDLDDMGFLGKHILFRWLFVLFTPCPILQRKL